MERRSERELLLLGNGRIKSCVEDIDLNCERACAPCCWLRSLRKTWNARESAVLVVVRWRVRRLQPNGNLPCFAGANGRAFAERARKMAETLSHDVVETSLSRQTASKGLSDRQRDIEGGGISIARRRKTVRPCVSRGSTTQAAILNARSSPVTHPTHPHHRHCQR